MKLLTYSFGFSFLYLFVTQEGRNSYVIKHKVLTGLTVEGQLKGLHVLKPKLLASGCGRSMLSNCTIKVHDIMHTGSFRENLHFQSEPCWNPEFAFSSPQLLRLLLNFHRITRSMKLDKHKWAQQAENPAQGPVWSSVLSVNRITCCAATSSYFSE